MAFLFVQNANISNKMATLVTIYFALSLIMDLKILVYYGNLHMDIMPTLQNTLILQEILMQRSNWL